MTSSEKAQDESPDEADGDQDEHVRIPIATTSLIIILVAIAGVYAYATYTESGDTYNGYEFRQVNGGFWATTITSAQGPTELRFRSHPRTVETIPMADGVDAVLRAIQERNGSLVITVGPEYDEGGRVAIGVAEITRKLKYQYGLNITGAVTEPSPATNASVITCDNVTPRRAVLEVRKGDPTRITRDQGCISLQATSPTDVIRAADRFVYGLFGII